jgi:quinol monooxygenase YgiN
LATLQKNPYHRTGTGKKKSTTTDTGSGNNNDVNTAAPGIYRGDLVTIRVVAKNHVKPEKTQKFMGLCEDLVKESLKEEGCIEYGVYQELENPEILTMLEEWKDESSLNEHLNSNHFKKIFPMLSECLDKETEINIYSKKL